MTRAELEQTIRDALKQFIGRPVSSEVKHEMLDALKAVVLQAQQRRLPLHIERDMDDPNLFHVSISEAIEIVQGQFPMLTIKDDLKDEIEEMKKLFGET